MTSGGIDVSKLSLDAAAILEPGEVERRNLANDLLGHGQLLAWLLALPDRLITFEATGTYHRQLVKVSEDAGERVSVLNPAQVSHFAKSQARFNKRDRIDALLLAMYGKGRQPAPSQEANSSLQSLARELNALQEGITRLKNRLEAAEHGLAHPPKAPHPSARRREGGVASVARERGAPCTRARAGTA